MKQIKYEYRRTITRVSENGNDLFVGYISLTKYNLIKEHPYVQYERTEQLNSNLIRNIQDISSIVAKLPEGDTSYELTEEIYSKLANAFITNHEWLWTYMTSL